MNRLVATLACAILWSAAARAEWPPYLQVKVQTVPGGATLCSGITDRGKDKVVIQTLPEDGLVTLKRSEHYFDLDASLPFRVTKDGFDPVDTRVQIADLVTPSGGPVPIWPAPVQLTPNTWMAWVQVHPVSVAAGAGCVLLGFAVAASAWMKLHTLRRGQLQRQAAIDRLGLERTEIIGSVIDGVQILEELGTGGMATVYRVQLVDDPNRSLALKVMHPGAQGERFLTNFHREVTLLARLRHPRLCLIHRAIDQGGIFGILMEYVEGCTLRSQVKGGGGDVDQILSWATAIAEGLFYVHSHNVVHRDLKPDNVMLTAQGKIKLMDFGIAREAAEADLISRGSSFAGTVAYMAPEQVSGQAITPALDQYALGSMLFELLTGRVPFPADNPLDSLRLHVSALVPDPCLLRDDLPRPFGQVLMRMLAKQPEERFADVVRAIRTLNHTWNQSTKD